MLQIGICDDEKESRFTLCYLLEQILEKRAMEAELYQFTSGDRLIHWVGKNAGKLDLVFLDIEMEGSNGMETAKRLRAADKNLQLVFVTGYPDFVYDGYSVGALGYLMKPPKKENLNDILTRAVAALHVAAPEDYICRNSDGVYRVPKASIRYFVSDKRQIIWFADAREYRFYAKLDEVAQEVGAGFVRIHQRYLVNAEMVERIEENSVWVEDKELPISRAYKKESVLALTKYMLN